MRSVSLIKEEQRQLVAKHVEEYLRKGGKIQHVTHEQNARNNDDPLADPRKFVISPESNVRAKQNWKEHRTV